ncbi:MAG: aldehyde dehydrogenase family protein [Georgenia sp.]
MTTTSAEQTGTAASTAPDLVTSRSPQDPGDICIQTRAYDAAAVHAAAATGRRVQQQWWASGPTERADTLAAVAEQLERRREEITTLMVREVGKPLTEARGEVARAIGIARYVSQLALAPAGSVLPARAGTRLWHERRPKGLAGIITPWNFPLAIPLWKLLPALAAGNSVLLKPSPDATATAQVLGSIFDDVAPRGLVQVVPGHGEAGEAVVAAADVVSFTGSEHVGSAIVVAAARRAVPIQAEMGGQNAAIVLEDADIDATARAVAAAAMGFAGQKCTATRRAVIVGSATRRALVRDALVAAVEGLEVGDPSRESVRVGPVISAASALRVADAAGATQLAGGRVLTGGTVRPEGAAFMAPCVVDEVAPDHPLSQEELFGPFLVLQDAATVDEAVALAEGVRYGLVTSIHGRDLPMLLSVVDRVQTGMIKVNAPTTGVDFHGPFGGERDSSYGPREQGMGALDFYSSARTVTVRGQE